MKCNKCLTDIKEDQSVGYSHFNGDSMDKYHLCHQCDSVLERCKEGMLFEFLKEDYGDFPISAITKNMIEARKTRSLNPGVSWNDMPYGKP